MWGLSKTCRKCLVKNNQNCRERESTSVLKIVFPEKNTSTPDDPKIYPWTLQGQWYPMYGLLVAPSPKLTPFRSMISPWGSAMSKIFAIFHFCIGHNVKFRSFLFKISKFLYITFIHREHAEKSLVEKESKLKEKKLKLEISKCQ